MLRFVRHKLRMIRYYSATRPDTPWTKAVDAALVCSLLLALPAAWMCDAMVTQRDVASALSGQLFRQPSNHIEALLLTGARKNATVNGNVIGNFQLIVEEVRRGWPFNTSINRLPARVDIDIVAELRPRPNAKLAADDPLHLAIDRALDMNGQDEAATAFARREPLTRQHWLSWVIATGVWWILLVFVSTFLIHAARLATLILQRKMAIRKASLRASGKCMSCGYDMTGLEFNEKCPECGELVW